MLHYPSQGYANLTESPHAVHTAESQKDRFDPLVGGPPDHISAYELGVGVVLRSGSDPPQPEVDLIGTVKILLQKASRMGRLKGLVAADPGELEADGIARSEQAHVVVAQPGRPGNLHGFLEPNLPSR